MSTDFDHIVIGAGISGLGAAHFSHRRGLRTMVLEASDRIGGCINTQAFEELGGFWTEGGGHTCFNSYGNLLSILDDLGMTGQVKPKLKVGYSLWKDGRRQSIKSALHFLEAARSIPRIFKAPKVGRSVRDYYGEVLGQRNYEGLLKHAFQAVICQPADDYPAEALFRRKKRRKEVIKAFTFADGISAIPAAIAAQPGLEIRTGQHIAAIEPDGAGFKIRLDDGSALAAGAATLAVPPTVAASLMPTGLEAARDAISGLGMATFDTLVLVFRTSDLDLPPIAGLIAVEDLFYSAVSRDFLPHPSYRGFAFHFKPNAVDEQAQVERACAALGTGPSSVVAQARLQNQLPALKKGHGEVIKRLDAALAGKRLGVTGNWFLGVSMEDALTRSRAESDRLFGA